MSDKSRGGEDIAGLFAAFGGDVGRYQEFDSTPDAEKAPSWTLLQQLGADPQAVLTPTPTPVPVAAPAVGTTAATVEAPPLRTIPGEAAQSIPNLTQAFAPDAAFQNQPVFGSTGPAARPAPVQPPVEPPPAAHAPAISAPAEAFAAPARSAPAAVTRTPAVAEPAGLAQPATPPPAVPPRAPAAVPTPAAAVLPAPAAAPTGTPLADLFERLARVPEPAAPAPHSLMAHWRQSG